jgi:molybdopterin molybdotransferase
VADRDEARQALRAWPHRRASAHFIGLPGNPVSSFVTFLLLVRPFLLKLQGASARWRRSRCSCRRISTGRAPTSAANSCARAAMRRAASSCSANQSSGVLTSTVWADGLIDNPAGQAIRHGDTVRFLPLAELLAA